MLGLIRNLKNFHIFLLLLFDGLRFFMNRLFDRFVNFDCNLVIRGIMGFICYLFIFVDAVSLCIFFSFRFCIN